jgi:hypothetical protein
LFEKNMQNGVVERWVGSMAVQFPITIEQIDFDGAVQDRTICDSDGGVLKIGAGLAIPKTELHDLDWFSSEDLEFSAKFTSEPTGLQFELVWNLG